MDVLTATEPRMNTLRDAAEFVPPPQPEMRRINHPSGGVMHVPIFTDAHARCVIVFYPGYDCEIDETSTRKEAMQYIQIMTAYDFGKSVPAAGTKYCYINELIKALAEKQECVCSGKCACIDTAALARAHDLSKQLLCTIESIRK